MDKRARSGLVSLFLWTSLAPTVHAHRLDLDIYSSEKLPPRPRADDTRLPKYDWKPGDPRNLRGESRLTQHLSTLGYAGLGIGGLAISIASGGVAPAIGFGIITAVQLWRLHGIRHPRALTENG